MRRLQAMILWAYWDLVARRVGLNVRMGEGTMGPMLQAILGSAVLAALLASLVTSLLQSWLQSKRDVDQRRRTATGMLQRAQSAATMLLQALESVQDNIETDTATALESLTGIMLSAEFTTATADLDLDDTYRELERMHSMQRLRGVVHAEVLRLRCDDARFEFFEFKDGSAAPNSEYDPAVARLLEGHEERYTWVVTTMRDSCVSLRQALWNKQARLANKIKR